MQTSTADEIRATIREADGAITRQGQQPTLDPPPSEACCASTLLSTCCLPDAKAVCCGSSAPMACGCQAGAAATR